jgi:hypothetical protein
MFAHRADKARAAAMCRVCDLHSASIPPSRPISL